MPEEEGPPPTPDWIVTFTDLMSLLLTFFILLLTFSTPKVEKLFELRGSIEAAFGIFGKEPNDRESTTPPLPIITGRERKNPLAPSQIPEFLELKDRDPNIAIYRLRDQSGEEIQFQRVADGWKVSLGGAVDFLAGETVMTSDSFPRLAKVAEAVELAVRNGRYHLVVNAQIGRNEINGLRDSQTDAMELALRRSVVVAEHLRDVLGIDPSRLAVAGQGMAVDMPEQSVAEVLIVEADRLGGR